MFRAVYDLGGPVEAHGEDGPIGVSRSEFIVELPVCAEPDERARIVSGIVPDREDGNMSREFPDWVNPWKAAEGKRIFSGTIPLKRMKRLGPLLSDVCGAAGFTARFSLDGEHRATVYLEVSAELPLTCQASLEAFTLPVRRASHLVIIEDVAEENRLPEHVDPAYAEAGRVRLAGLVEDELLLALPQVPRKPGLEAVRYSTEPGDAAAVEQPEDSHRPFAALGSLLRPGRDREPETD
jgi:uncharacterized protein